MDSGGDERNNHRMPQELCVRGRELFSKASAADDLFKARLLEFFSLVKKDDDEMKQIEALGERHRDADEAFHRHQKFCVVCAELDVAVLRYAGAD